MDEVMRERLAFSMRVQSLRTVYHWAIGEVIQLRLAFREVPEIDMTEHLDTDSVVMHLGDDALTLHPGHTEVRETIRAWILQRVDVTRLEPGPHRGAGVRYWRGVACE